MLWPPLVLHSLYDSHPPPWDQRPHPAGLIRAALALAPVWMSGLHTQGGQGSCPLWLTTPALLAQHGTQHRYSTHGGYLVKEDTNSSEKSVFSHYDRYVYLSSYVHVSLIQTGSLERATGSGFACHAAWRQRHSSVPLLACPGPFPPVHLVSPEKAAALVGVQRLEMLPNLEEDGIQMQLSPHC